MDERINMALAVGVDASMGRSVLKELLESHHSGRMHGDGLFTREKTSLE